MKPIKFLKFWWKYNMTKAMSEDPDELPSALFFFVSLFSIGLLVIFECLSNFPNLIKKWKQEKKDFWLLWKNDKT